MENRVRTVHDRIELMNIEIVTQRMKWQYKIWPWIKRVVLRRKGWQPVSGDHLTRPLTEEEKKAYSPSVCNYGDLDPVKIGKAIDKKFAKPWRDTHVMKGGHYVEIE
jgi:hypothetical protein